MDQQARHSRFHLPDCTSSADAETSLLWQDGSTTQNYVVASPGTYSLVASNRCGVDSDTAVISFQSLPVPFELGPDQVLCPDDTLILTAPVTSDNLSWQDGSTSNTFSVSASGIYILTVSNQCGSVSDHIGVSYNDRSVIFPVDDHLEVCPGEVVILDVTQAFPASYIWNTGGSSPSISVSSPGDYVVTVSTACQQDTHVIQVHPGGECTANKSFFIPNLFSPDGDGVNDLFVISWSHDLDITSMDGNIYDRWGNVVFSSKENPFTWDGYFEDQKVMAGVYVYKVQVKYNLDGKEVNDLFVGDVTVIR